MTAAEGGGPTGAQKVSGRLEWRVGKLLTDTTSAEMAEGVSFRMLLSTSHGARRRPDAKPPALDFLARSSAHDRQRRMD